MAPLWPRRGAGGRRDFGMVGVVAGGVSVEVQVG